LHDALPIWAAFCSPANPPDKRSLSTPDIESPMCLSSSSCHSLKLQAPTSKHQRNSNNQTTEVVLRLELGAWCFSGAWSLGFGALPIPGAGPGRLAHFGA